MQVSVNDLNLAWRLLGHSRFPEAAAKSAEVLESFPDNVSALACHAMATWKCGSDVSASIAEMQRAIDLAPNVASIRHNFATLLASNGDMDGANAQFRKALEIKPDDAQAFYGLSQNFKFCEEDEMVRAMVALQAKPGLDPAVREFLSFGLTKAFADLKQPAKAMAYAADANSLVNRGFDLPMEQRSFSELKQMTAEDAFRKLPTSGSSSTAPLFIVGMNRSGTTLVESILSRHPDVVSEGEQGRTVHVELAALSAGGPGLARGRQGLLSTFKTGWLKAQADAILASVAERAAGPFKVFTDKLPENALRLGLIAQLFPKAKVIFVRRHPLDAGISNYFQRFAAGQGFSYRQDWIGTRTRQIADSMGLWKQAVDLPILDLSYELLVADAEAQSRRIVNFAGLSWDEACLSPEKSARSVLTASQFQVRQPINSGSVGRWKAYEQWLEPMIAAMGGRDWIENEVAAARAAGI